VCVPTSSQLVLVLVVSLTRARFPRADLVARGWPVASEALTSSSRGIIGATTFGVLPNVSPRLTFGLTFAITSLFLVKLWFDPSFKRFLDSVVLAAMTSFLFGWHVHEKAVLLFLIPLRCVSLSLSYAPPSLASVLTPALAA